MPGRRAGRDCRPAARLFDLTPTEAGLATGLASGLTLAQFTARHGITVKSARTYLERIFRKTGTSPQGQVVAMLKTVQPLVSSA